MATNVSAWEKPLSELSDQELDALLSSSAPPAELANLSDEEIDQMLGTFRAPGGNIDVEKPPVLEKEAPELSVGETLAGGARELAGGAAFEFADEAEAAVRSAATGEDYEKVLRDIRQSRAKFSEAYPGTAFGLNVAGGIGSAFLPGVGALGRGAEVLTGISKIASPFKRTVARGAAQGAVSGFGSGEDLEGRLSNASLNALFGGGFGAGAYGVGKGANWAREAFTARGVEMTEEEAGRRAAAILADRMARSELSPQEFKTLLDLEQRYGIPSVLGTASPELERLTETVINVPSDERTELARRLVSQQANAKERVKGQIRTSIPTPDYFASEESILRTLRSNAEKNYGAGWKDVEIKDPRIMQILNDPDIRGAYQSALENTRREQSAALLRGEDPSQFKLREIFEPVLNEEGALVGLKGTGREAPDMRTLDQIKQSLDRRVNELYASGQGGNATALKGIRDAFVKRLDEIGPDEYKAARQQYKGDIEVKEALEMGRAGGKMRWQEVAKAARKYSPGELQAFKTGYVQHLMKGFEDTANRKNWAKNIIESDNTRNSLRALMDKDEFKVFEAALKRESELFDSINRITKGSQTFGRAAEKEALEQEIGAGNVMNAVDLLTSPKMTIAMRALRAVNDMKNANVSKATFNQLAKMLRAGSPDEIDEVLTAIENAAPAQKAASEAFEGKASKVATAGARVSAPSPEEELPEEVPVEFTVPSLEEEPTGLSVMPGQELPVAAPEIDPDVAMRQFWADFAKLTPQEQEEFKRYIESKGGVSGTITDTGEPE
jgi:hypothetical protein